MVEKGELSLKQNIIWNTVGMSVYLGCQWLVTILVVRLSSFANSGLLTLAMSVTNIFYAVAIYNLRIYQVSDVREKYSNATYLHARSLTCAASLILCAGYSLVLYRDERFVCIVLYMVFKALEALVDIFHGVDQKAGRMDIIGKSLMVRGVGTVLAFAVVIRVTDSLNLAVMAMIGVTVTVMLLYDVPRAASFSPLAKAPCWKDISFLLAECFPLGVASALSSSITTIPRSMLEYYSGAEILGIYGAIATPTVIVQVAATYISNPLQTTFALYYAEKNREGFYKLMKQSLLVIAGLSALAIGGAVLLKDFFLGLLLGEKIMPYTYLFIPMLIATILNAFSWFVANLLIVIRDFKSYFIGTVGTVVLVAAAGAVLIPRYSSSGVNTALIVALAAEVVYFTAKLFWRAKQNFARKDDRLSEE